MEEFIFVAPDGDFYTKESGDLNDIGNKRRYI